MDRLGHTPYDVPAIGLPAEAAYSRQISTALYGNTIGADLGKYIEAQLFSTPLPF
jgi:hypothetical protein